MRQEIAAELHEMLAVYGPLAVGDGDAINLPRRLPTRRMHRGLNKSSACRSLKQAHAANRGNKADD